MSEVTKQDLADSENRLRVFMRETTDHLLDAILSEMGTRFGEVNARLDRVDATLQVQAKQIAGGTKAIAGFTEWISKADADYTRVLAELADMKARLAKLERAS
jgi:hypothetical protein